MGKPVTVLMIEDDDEDYLIARSLFARITAVRFVLERRASLREGLDAIGIDTDVVLLDLSLPDSQGWDTFLRVRKHAPHLPIILLTGLDDEVLGMQAVQGGAQDYLVKGQFDGRLLARAVLYAIERKIIEERLEHLADELGVANANMADDLAMAREVQQAIVPREVPKLPDGGAEGFWRMGMLYRPCKSLGGDFYSILPISKTEVGILVCDVVGHGVRSALVTAVLRGLVEEARPAARDPGRFLTQINQTLLKVLVLPNQVLFVTTVYVFLNIQTGVFSQANAGHPPLLRVRASGTAEWLDLHGDCAGPALGLESTFVYRTVASMLDIGDRLVLYTNGINEACSPDGEEYGRDRLLAAALISRPIPIEDVPNFIFSDLLHFVGGGDFEDDVCIVSVERGNPPVPEVVS